MADHRGRAARARVLARAPTRAAPFTRADLAGPHHGPRLLPVRVLAGLHRPAERLQRGAGGLRRARARRSTASPATRPGRSRRSRSSSGIDDRAALGLRAQGRGVPRVRRAAPGGFPQRALVHDRPRRRACAGATRPTRPATCPARTSSSTRSTRRLSDLGSAPLPPLGPGDHVRGPERRAAGDRLRRLRVPVLRGARGCACASCRCASRSATSRSARAIRARCAAALRRRGGRALQDALLADARRAVRRPGPSRGPAPVGARRAARARRRALRRRPALRRGRGARPRRLPRRRARRAWRRRPTLFVDGERHAGRPDDAVGGSLGA